MPDDAEMLSSLSVAAKFMGNGYATEVTQSMMEYVRKHFGGKHFCSSHAEPNNASGRVMKKCGVSIDSILMDFKV